MNNDLPAPLRAFSEAALQRGDLAEGLCLADAADALERQQERISELEREVVRQDAWLGRIEGGDLPCTDETQLRQWAYEAHTLRKEAPSA